ncbi:hypothetical protein BN14_01043 [Rhizoctonia solani AG-1 IB]|uniref:Uncharacterized protein n=1 Tax=Thanatephorus cucumeris (strain AG1-IB / isolate 7/3/14) TaxID=1108050 RepID=M5BLD4_THACB|nr:hypothetical protein BN14_01043 [Rhizoctonia solani AG-1 IB]
MLPPRLLPPRKPLSRKTVPKEESTPKLDDVLNDAAPAVAVVDPSVSPKEDIVPKEVAEQPKESVAVPEVASKETTKLDTNLSPPTTQTFSKSAPVTPANRTRFPDESDGSPTESTKPESLRKKRHSIFGRIKSVFGFGGSEKRSGTDSA